MLNLVPLLMFCAVLISCAPYSLKDSPNVFLVYEINVIDVNGKSMKDVSVHYKVDEGRREYLRFVKDTLELTSVSGQIVIKIFAKVDPKSYYLPEYNSNLEFEVSKEGYFSQLGKLSFFIANGPKVKSATIMLVKPTDYLHPTFLSSSEGDILKSKILGFIDLLRFQSLISDSYLETLSIKLDVFKQNKYLSFKFINGNTYNSIRSSKYDIAKTLFDDVIRKVLNPLNDYLGDATEFYGYDLSVAGFSSNFIDKNSPNKKIVYRYLIPNEVARKYKSKDITGQQLLDSSIILMDDERIDLKLQ